jgi:tellurite resistance protein TerC
VTMLPWIVFGVVVLAMLALDLGVFHRKSHEVQVKEALIWSGIWVTVSLAFAVGVHFWKGHEHALQFVTGYLIEQSLSIDNIFVFVLLFKFFKVPPKYQHKVLYWGILSAFVMRGILIVVGSALIQRFEWIFYVFGAFLIYTGFKMAFNRGAQVDPEHNPVVRLTRRMVPMSATYHADHFFVKEAGRWLATPLLLVLLTVEATDLVFAVDSIPAIFAVTREPFIVYTSNVFAILGLRSLYFALAGIIDRFRYLNLGLAVVLVFVGVKMLLAHHYKVPIGLALGVVFASLVSSVLASLWIPEKKPHAPH